MKKIILFLLAIYGIAANAHQPVMDMAPRWEDGYGFQIRHEHYGSNKLMNGDSKVDNSSNQKFSINKTWYEGVYTFDKSKRITFKIPYVQRSKTSNGIKEENSGFGDLTLAVPLKYYTNYGAFTSNLGVTPQIRLSMGGSSGNLPISDGSTDVGLSISYSTETPKFYQMFDLFYWINNQGEHQMNDGNELGVDINLAYHPIHNNKTNSGVFLMWDLSMRKQEQGHGSGGQINGGSRIYSGPILVLYRENTMFRAEYKLPVYEYFEGVSLSRGNELNVGIGITF